MNPKVITRTILPHPLLQPHLTYIAVRDFDTKDVLFPKAIFAQHEIAISIFLDGQLQGFEKCEATGSYTFSPSNTIQCYYTGIQTSTKGFIQFKGKTSVLTLHFKPAGFYHIFKLSPKVIVDLHGEVEDLFGKEVALLFEQMKENVSLSAKIVVLEQYLIQKLLHPVRQYQHAAIQYAADCLIAAKGNLQIKKLARDCNLSQQTLEVRFIEMIGVDPKSFASNIRFNAVVMHKLYNPSLTWTELAHEHGYFDQMHLIKTFRKFSGLSPKEFMYSIHPPHEEFDTGS